MRKRKFAFRTDFLLPNNSFVVGMGSVMNLSGSYFKYNTSSSSKEADLKALSSDWKNIGEDIKIALAQLKNV
jgi:hypothetical protein